MEYFENSLIYVMDALFDPKNDVRNNTEKF